MGLKPRKPAPKKVPTEKDHLHHALDRVMSLRDWHMRLKQQEADAFKAWILELMQMMNNDLIPDWAPRPMPEGARFVICETMAAISLHLRQIPAGQDPSYGGPAYPGAMTLCGKPMGWDTKIPANQVTCSKCAELQEKFIPGTSKA